MRLAAAALRTVQALAELVLPVACAGCDGPPDRGGVCRDCAGILAEAPKPARPTPAPVGLPACLTGGDYAGADLPEAAALRRWGGQAVVLPYLEGRSTTALVERSRT